MAMLQLGKLKFRVKDGGVDFRWGDGEVRRLGRKSSEDNEEYNGQDYDDQYSEFAEFDEESELNYGGRYADDYEDRYEDDGYADDGYDDRYADDGYADDGYDDHYADDGYADGYDDRYADDGYDDGYDDRYADDGYDDGYDDRYADDGYDDGYADDRYADDGYDDQEYDDRYSDEDADGGYGYEPYDDQYDDYVEGGLMQYVDDNDWVTYLLLVLLPPLGIYLLWRRQRFEPVIRYSVMAASAVWFVVMIILLITLVFSGHNEVIGDPQLPTLKPTVEATASPTPSVAPSVTPNTTSALVGNLSPAATPLGGGVQATLPDGSVVWASASGNFYHNNQACTLASGETLAQTTIENAKNRNKYACPECYGGQLYYATAGGDYYHLDSTCNDMQNAELYTKEKAEAEKKPPCPVCVTKTQQTLVKVPESLTFITENTKDKSGIKVWCTVNGDNYHMTSGCRGMKGAKQVTLVEALLRGKTACKTCCEVSGEIVYCTKNGTSYHSEANCTGMKGASKVTIAEALVLGKKECRTCRPVANSANGAANAGDSGNAEDAAEEYYVYATKNGTYYHVKKNCTGMSGASKVTLKSMIAEGRPACPECCGGAGMSVYASKGGTYYHSYATCTGMTNAEAGSLSDALAKGYKRCPRCWGESGSTVSGNTNSGGSGASTATSDTVMVYATTKGTWYHTKSTCTGMKNARHITLTQAMDEGKTACPTCATTAVKIVYSNRKGKYYHKANTCDNMTGASKRTLAEALKLGQTACPVCMSGKTEGEGTDDGAAPAEPEKVADFKVGTSGIKVYTSDTQKYFHTKKSCTSAELSHVALETALNYGRKACPKCASSASETVYATKNGKYYHITKSCAGSGAVKGTLAEALAYGYSPCLYCVKGEFDEDGGSGDYDSGRSGIKVYATTKGSYYHTKQSCAGNGAVKITLETALNYGKKACQDCCAIANRTVYAGGVFYHANRDCAGDDASKSTYAKALAGGLDACPNCIGGAGQTPDDAPEYEAPAESSVYIDLYADRFYYHKASKCSEAGMKNGTEVTLEYAKDFGYERCPYCNPASDVE